MEDYQQRLGTSNLSSDTPLQLTSDIDGAWSGSPAQPHPTTGQLVSVSGKRMVDRETLLADIEVCHSNINVACIRYLCGS